MELDASVSLFMGAWSQTQDVLVIYAKHISMVCGDDLFVGVDASCLHCQEGEQLSLVVINAEKVLPVTRNCT